MDTNIISAIIQTSGSIFVTVLIFVLGIWIGKRQQSRRLLVQLQVISTSLVKRDGFTHPLSIYVDRQFITGDPKDKDEFIPVTGAYLHNIRIINSGDEVILNCATEVQLDDKAVIVKSETDPPEGPNYAVLAARNFERPNELSVNWPYINRNQEVTLEVISVSDSGGKCDVKIMGPGIRVETVRQTVARTQAFRTRFGMVLFSTSAVGLVGTILLWFRPDNDPSPLWALVILVVLTSAFGVACSILFYTMVSVWNLLAPNRRL